MKATKKRVKRYDGGGETSADQRAFYGFSDEDQSPGEGVDIYAAARKRDQDKANSDAYEAKIQESSKDSDSTSSNAYSPKLNIGNRPDLSDQYTTTPSPKKDSAVSKAKDNSSGAATSSSRQSDELAVKSRANAALARRIAQTKAQEAGGMESHPELMLNPGRIGTKTIMEAAQALARGKGAAKGIADRIEPYMESAAPYLKELPNRATKLIEGYRPNFTMMKKGGKVKASASSKPTQSSASRRGDGIATRGKTRGKYL
jgi:hypothetical protein